MWGVMWWKVRSKRIEALEPVMGISWCGYAQHFMLFMQTFALTGKA